MAQEDSEGVQASDLSGKSLEMAVVTTVRLKREGCSNPVARAHAPGHADVAQPIRIGRFVIVRRIGVGGMGMVYSAYDEELDRKVAIKVLHADSGGSSGRARILREAQVLARLSHPNIIHVYEVGELDNGQVFMAMEFFEGMTVYDWAHAKQRSWRALLSIYLQTAEGLAAAHEIGLIHRDVKPENILVDGRGRAVLLDFGLARMRGDASDRPTQEPTEEDAHSDKVLGRIAEVTSSEAEVIARTLTATGSIMGTPAYMSPEQCAGLPADARSDQFSFCVSLYEGLYGERPFAGRNLSEVIVTICQGEVRDAPRGSRVSTWLRRVLLRGLSVKPSERWPSMQALAQALRRDRQSIRRRWLGAGAVAASVALGVFGAWQPWAGPELCHGAQQRLQGVWDMPRQQAVEQALTATGFAYGEQSWSIVDEGISAYTKSWAQTYEQACTVHHRGETSAELYDRQMECLDRRLTEVDALVDILADADAMVLQQTSELIAGLQPVATCGDTESLRESYAPPSNQKTADAVRNLRSELVRIRLRADAGHADKVVEAAEGAVRAARTLGYRPVIAEALFQLGFVRMGLMQEQETQ
ncbi:MAG: serine/threonine-protein kinase, partial [Nannocystaceae bacterium]